MQAVLQLLVEGEELWMRRMTSTSPRPPAARAAYFIQWCSLIVELLKI
jgi:hypothetical protein